MGTHRPDPNDDYPDYAQAVAAAIVKGQVYILSKLARQAGTQFSQKFVAILQRWPDVYLRRLHFEGKLEAYDKCSSCTNQCNPQREQ